MSYYQIDDDSAKIVIGIFLIIKFGNIFLTAVTIDETSKKLEKVKSGRLSKVVKTTFCLKYFLPSIKFERFHFITN